MSRGKKEIIILKTELEKVCKKLCDWLNPIVEGEMKAVFKVNQYYATQRFVNTEAPNIRRFCIYITFEVLGKKYSDDYPCYHKYVHFEIREDDKKSFLEETEKIKKNLFNELLREMMITLFENYADYNIHLNHDCGTY